MVVSNAYNNVKTLYINIGYASKSATSNYIRMMVCVWDLWGVCVGTVSNSQWNRPCP